MNSNIDLTLNALGHCYGYGSENAKYFFFGLEEKEVLESSESKRYLAYVKKFEKTNNFYYLSNEEIYALCPECQNEDMKQTNRLYPMYKHIYETISEDSVELTEIGSSHKPILIGNLFPFEKKETNFSYKKEEESWWKSNLEDRVKSIINLLIEKAEKNYVFCFGKIFEYCYHFNKIGNLDLGKPKGFSQYAHRSNIYFKHPELNLYLLRHPSKGWLTKKQINEILDGFKHKIKSNIR